MKRLLTGLLCLGLFAAVLCGCSSNTLPTWATDTNAVLEDAQSLIAYTHEGDFAALTQRFDPMIQADEEYIRTSLTPYLDQLGPFVKWGSAQMAGAEYDGIDTLVVAVEAVYENGKAVYTLTFTEDMHLLGYLIR